jgi:hypothetical protein
MKTKITRETLYMVIWVLIWFLSIVVTGIGLEEKDPLKIWPFPVLALIFLSWCIFLVTRDLCLRWRYKQRRELKETGVLDFISAVSPEEDILRIIHGRSSDDACVGQLIKLQREEGHAKQVNGIVCGEEIVGYAEGMHLTVTVTKPETERAFRRIPKYLKKYVTVVYVPE